MVYVAPAQRMTCCRCKYVWIDGRGTLGRHAKHGCPKCSSLYWQAVEQSFLEIPIKEPAPL